MAPLPSLLFGRRINHISNNNGRSSNGGTIGGGVVAAIIALVVIVFICIYVSEYNKAKRIHAQTGAPVSHGECFKKAILIALTLGLVSLCCAECCDSGSGNNGDAGNTGGGAPQMEQAGGFVQQPMPSYQPQMDWAPVNSAAADGVQG